MARTDRGVVREIGIRSSAASPIVVDGRTWGALSIHSKTSPLPSGTESRMAEFTPLVATAIENIEMRTAVRRLADEQAALRRVATQVARDTSAAEVFAAVAGEVGRLLAMSVATSTAMRATSRSWWRAGAMPTR
jgi:GAF domain-containing protein